MKPCRLAPFAAPAAAACAILAATARPQSAPLPAATPARAPEPVPVHVAPAARGEVTRFLTLPGTLRANQQVTLHSRVAGHLQSITVDRGDRVAAGQRLATIEVPELAADQARHQAEVQVAEREVRRLAQARAQSPDLVTPQAVDDAQGRLDVARALLNRATSLLGFAQLHAPFAGVVTARFADPGAFLPAATGTPASAVLTLADTATLRAVAQVPEPDALRIRPGQPVRVTFEELPGRTFPATVSRHSEALEESTRTLWVEADLPNPDGLLRPGLYATIRLGVERHPAALRVPATAVVAEKAASFVHRVVEGRTRKTPVQLGFVEEPWAEILSGLEEGARVVVPGKSAPPDGTAVAAQDPP